MKKLFGVVMLAALPVACGTDLTAPSAPSVGAPASEETFAASRIAPTCSEKADWSSVKGVAVAVSGRGRGSVTVRASLLILAGAGPTPCYTAVFSVKPSGRGIALQPGSNPREATLRAPSGTYEISVLAEGPAKPAHTASMVVEIPGK